MKREGQFAFPIFGQTIHHIFTDYDLLWYSDMGNPLEPLLRISDLWLSCLGAFNDDVNIYYIYNSNLKELREIENIFLIYFTYIFRVYNENESKKPSNYTRFMDENSKL